jgi:hypothetical protein
MSVVEAKIQTVEEMYRLIWTAIENRQPISAIYKERPRLFCPHRLGRNRLGEPRVLCYQYGGESESGLGPIGSPENWRCVVFEKLRCVELVDGSWKTAPTILVQRLVWWRQILTSRINRSATRRRDIEQSRRTGAEPRPFSRW